MIRDTGTVSDAVGTRTGDDTYVGTLEAGVKNALLCFPSHTAAHGRNRTTLRCVGGLSLDTKYSSTSLPSKKQMAPNIIVWRTAGGPVARVFCSAGKV
jgi:hypothetical protein